MANFMTKLFVGTLALFMSVAPAADAQTFPKPTDVVDYVEVVPTYASGTDVNEPLDPGTTPYTAVPLTGDATPTTGRTFASSAQPLTQLNGGPAFEAKMRTHANVTKTLHDDPIRHFGQPGASHCHIFFGSQFINAFSTHASLRANAASFAAGAEINATGYWYPCPKKGAKIIKPKNVTIYYSEEPANGVKSVIPPEGLRYILGTDMDDRYGTKYTNRVAAANAQAGTAGRYTVSAGGSAQIGKYRYKCIGATPETSASLKNLDNSDPFAGTCLPGQDLAIVTEGPTCWDGVNLWSPGGYDHVIYGIWDTLANEFVCPTNYYRIAALQLQITHEHNGFADYGEWRLDSDDHLQMSSGNPVANGESFHTDWMDGWDRTVFELWQGYCIGARDNNDTVIKQPHECDSGAISENLSLITGQIAPNGRFPQVDIVTEYDSDDPEGFWPVPAQSNGPATVHLHGDN